MLVLLIVFMVTAPMLTVGVPVNLPETNADSLPDDNEPLTVSINAKGEIFLNGKPVHSLPIEKRKIGMIFQDPLMFPHLTVSGNLLFSLETQMPRKQRKEIISQTLKSIGMEGFEHRDALTLSGGQKARLALMRSLLAKPQALLLDEPFSGLDGQTRDEFAALVKNEINSNSLPVLMVSHDPRDITYADRPAIEL